MPQIWKKMDLSQNWQYFSRLAEPNDDKIDSDRHDKNERTEFKEHFHASIR